MLAKVDEITKEIIRLKNQTSRNILEIGNLLIAAKSELDHGEWLQWLQHEVDFTDRTAQRFMQVAREFSNSSIDGLSPTQVIVLLAFPKDTRQKILEHPQLVPSSCEKKNVKDMSVREISEVARVYAQVEREFVGRESSDRLPNYPRLSIQENSSPLALQFDALIRCIERRDINTLSVYKMNANDTSKKIARIKLVEYQRHIDEQIRNWERILAETSSDHH